MTDTTWTLHTKNNGTVSIDALTAEWPTVTRGREATFRLWLESTDYNTDLILSDGESYTVTADETRQRVVVKDGGTLTVNDGVDLTVDAGGFPLLLELLDYAGAAATGTDIDNVPFYRERLPDANQELGVSSIAVGLEPSTALDDRSIKGVWGVVTGGRDARNSPLTNYQIELQLFVLAEFDFYTDHEDLEASFKV